MTPSLFRYLLALGSNTGDRLQMLKAAIHAIQHSIGSVSAQSAVYETEPMGAADSLFLNMSLIVETSIPPQDVMPMLITIEEKLGRVRKEKWGNRTIDLDILLCEKKENTDHWSPVLANSDTLSLPHPEMLNRIFVLLPAIEIASDWQHPGEKLTLANALTNRFDTDDHLAAKRLNF